MAARLLWQGARRICTSGLAAPYSALTPPIKWSARSSSSAVNTSTTGLSRQPRGYIVRAVQFIDKHIAYYLLDSICNINQYGMQIYRAPALWQTCFAASPEYHFKVPFSVNTLPGRPGFVSGLNRADISSARFGLLTKYVARGLLDQTCDSSRRNMQMKAECSLNWTGFVKSPN